MDNNTEIAVSIVCITYNQKKYVGKMLESLINQNTNFKYEILIHDDASYDGTQDIILEYENKYPEKIKAILQKENQYSKGINPNITYNYPRVKGKYVAYCEGDDYWNDPNKLQMQFDAMEQNLDCSVCVHMTQCVSKIGDKLDRLFPPISLKEEYITMEQYIKLEFCDAGWMFQTSSYFIRKNVIRKYVNEYDNKYPVGDLPLMLFSLMNGNCYYIPRIMSCYRVDSGGAMSSLKNPEKRIKFYSDMVRGHKNFDKFSNYLYHDMFEYIILDCEIEILLSKNKYKDICKNKYKKNRRKMSVKRKLFICLGSIFPELACYLKKIIKSY